MNTFKILLLGTAGVGKSTWLHKIKSGEFQSEYIPTEDINVIPVKYKDKTFIFHDHSGKDSYIVIGEKYYEGAHAALIFYDDFGPMTLKIAKRDYLPRVKNNCGNVPIHLIANKSSNMDIKDDVNVTKPLEILYDELSKSITN